MNDDIFDWAIIFSPDNVLDHYIFIYMLRKELTGKISST